MVGGHLPVGGDEGDHDVAPHPRRGGGLHRADGGRAVDGVGALRPALAAGPGGPDDGVGAGGVGGTLLRAGAGALRPEAAGRLPATTLAVNLLGALVLGLLLGLFARRETAAGHPRVLRLALGTVHHRSTVEFSEETLADAEALWERLSGAILRAYEFSDDGGLNPVDAPAEQVRARALPAEFTAAMDEDLNLAGAMAVVHATLKALNVALTQAAPSGGQGADDALRASVTGLALDLRSQLDVLGLDPLAEPWRAHVLGGAGAGSDAAMDALDHLVTALLDQRARARAAKDWASADALRNQLAAAGVVVEDSPSGARWHLA